MPGGSIIATPGSITGPCVECEHKTCVELRRVATAICFSCDEVIGYLFDWDDHPVHGVGHQLCVTEQVEQEREALEQVVGETLVDAADIVIPTLAMSAEITGVIVDGEVYTPGMTLIGPVVDFSVTCYLCGRLHGLSGWAITKAQTWLSIAEGYYKPGGRYPFDDTELARLTAQPVRELAVCTFRAACIDARRMQDLVKVSIARTASGRARHVRRLPGSFESVRSIALCGVSTLIEAGVAVNLDKMCKRCEKINASEVTSRINYQIRRDHLDSLARPE